MCMQCLQGAFEQARRTGTFVMPWSKHSEMTYVDYRDVAEAAALAFTGKRLSRGTFNPAGPGMIDRVRLAELAASPAGCAGGSVEPASRSTAVTSRPGAVVIRCSPSTTSTASTARVRVLLRCRGSERSSASAETAVRPCGSDYGVPSMAGSQLRRGLALRALAP